MKLPPPNGPPHGGMDFARSKPEPDPPRATYVEARSLVPGDVVLVRNSRRIRVPGQRREQELVFDEDRVVLAIMRKRDKRIRVCFEAVRDRESECTVSPTHRFIAVKVRNPIVPKSKP